MDPSLTATTVEYLADALRPTARDTGAPSLCDSCLGVNGDYQCATCHQVECADCTRRNHEENPLHQIQRWNGGRYEPASLKQLGVRLQVGHVAPDSCPNPSPVEDYRVITPGGLLEVGLRFCACADAQAQNKQLMEAQLLPASAIGHHVVITFEMAKMAQRHSTVPPNIRLIIRRVWEYEAYRNKAERQRRYGCKWTSEQDVNERRRTDAHIRFLPTPQRTAPPKRRRSLPLASEVQEDHNLYSNAAYESEWQSGFDNLLVWAKTWDGQSETISSPAEMLWETRWGTGPTDGSTAEALVYQEIWAEQDRLALAASQPTLGERIETGWYTETASGSSPEAQEQLTQEDRAARWENVVRVATDAMTESERLSMLLDEAQAERRLRLRFRMRPGERHDLLDAHDGIWDWNWQARALLPTDASHLQDFTSRAIEYVDYTSSILTYSQALYRAMRLVDLNGFELGDVFIVRVVVAVGIGAVWVRHDARRDAGEFEIAVHTDVEAMSYEQKEKATGFASSDL
ncbi:hypothetical protein C8R43DRAFT_957215 [Mycena crocata]|nr:hypothetical protein C8R43DRAFT_957215 [Mycena crocata]